MSRLDRKRIMAKRGRHRRARYRIRSRIAGTAERPRLAVHKSLRYIYAQLIDDRSGKTLAQASSLEAAIRADLEGSAATAAAARAVGKQIAARAKESGVEQAVFDRGGYIYHGRVKELAEGAREGGLKL